MTRGHISVQLLDSIIDSEGSVLLVHVVSSRLRIITQPHTEVLHLVGILLEHLIDSHEFTIGSLDLLELGHVIPESRFRNDVISRKDFHPENSWNHQVLSGLRSAYNDELMHGVLVRSYMQ